MLFIIKVLSSLGTLWILYCREYIQVLDFPWSIRRAMIMRSPQSCKSIVTERAISVAVLWHVMIPYNYNTCSIVFPTERNTYRLIFTVFL